MENVIFFIFIIEFWIAERFFKGEFVKYNNNNGFIDDSKSNINNFS